MKKTLFFILALFSLTACDHVQYQGPPIIPTECDKWIVEDKGCSRYKSGKHKYLLISNIEHPTRRTTIEVGHYTFEHINIGDTVTKSGKKLNN